jgi:alpha-D-xyloside xylohydrolase
MKFSDGYWSLRRGISAKFPVEVWEVEAGVDSLVVQATTKRVATRGDTINETLLTAEFSSPMPDVIRVQWTHHFGGKPASPEFVLRKSATPSVDVSATEDSASLSSGRLAVRVSRTKDWRVEFLAAGRALTFSGRKGLGFFETEDGGRHLREQLALGIGECVYGLGERFTAFVKNGQSVEIWNSDGGTGSEQAYKNIPFYLTNRGYGVFVNHPGRVSFEVASERTSGGNFSVSGEFLEYYIL